MSVLAKEIMGWAIPHRTEYRLKQSPVRVEVWLVYHDGREKLSGEITGISAAEFRRLIPGIVSAEKMEK